MPYRYVSAKDVPDADELQAVVTPEGFKFDSVVDAHAHPNKLLCKPFVSRRPAEQTWSEKVWAERHALWHRNYTHPMVFSVHPTHDLVQLKDVVFCTKCVEWMRGSRRFALWRECQGPLILEFKPRRVHVVLHRLKQGKYPYGGSRTFNDADRRLVHEPNEPIE